jgi:hypothetical protein
LQLVGAPEAYGIPETFVPAGVEAFEFPVRFAFGAPAGEVKDVKFEATVLPGGARATAGPLVFDVRAGDPPASPHRLFEDEAGFVQQLTEGGATARLELDDRYSGLASLHVTPDQKFRTKLPGLGVEIVENPGPGQFRYLRYAWKKRGGANILLQLNVGKWGPTQGQDGPAYRYEAGGGPNPFQAKAVRVAEQLPGEWVVVTRDLFADFGAFRLEGIAFTATDGEAALFDHLYLGRSEADFPAAPAK